MLFQWGRIVDERSTRARMHDAAAVQNHGVVRDPKDFLGMLLDHDGRHALLADDPLQGRQQVFDDDRRESFGWAHPRSMSFGLSTRARATASICCSPPES